MYTNVRNRTGSLFDSSRFADLHGAMSIARRFHDSILADWIADTFVAHFPDKLGRWRAMDCIGRRMRPEVTAFDYVHFARKHEINRSLPGLLYGVCRDFTFASDGYIEKDVKTDEEFRQRH